MFTQTAIVEFWVSVPSSEANILFLIAFHFAYMLSHSLFRRSSFKGAGALCSRLDVSLPYI